MTAPLAVLARNLIPEIHRFLLKNNTVNLGLCISTLSFDTVVSISTLVCGILGAIGVMKINAIGSYAMIGVSCSITAAYLIRLIFKIIEAYKKPKYEIV